MEKNTMMRTVLYRKHNVKDENSNSAWNEFHTKYIFRDIANCILSDVYEETDNVKKPVLQKLLKDCEQGNIDIVVFDKMHDLSADPTDVDRIFRQLNGLEHPVGVYFFYENICSLDKDALASVQIVTMIESYQNEIRNRRRKEMREFALIQKQSEK